MIKSHFGRGYLPQCMLDNRMKSFYLSEVSNANLAINNGVFNLRKKKTRDREAKLKQLVLEFSTLNCEDKKELIFDYSLKLGCLSKEFYTQKFLKDLDEVAELDITRIDPGLFDNTIDDCMPGLEPSVIDCNGDYIFKSVNKKFKF